MYQELFNLVNNKTGESTDSQSAVLQQFHQSDKNSDRDDSDDDSDPMIERGNNFTFMGNQDNF